VTIKTILERLYLVSELAPICAPSQMSLCTHTPIAHSPAISRFPCNFFPKWPLILLVSTIRQVIWPTSGTLATLRSGYRKSARLPLVPSKLLFSGGHSGKSLIKKKRKSRSGCRVSGGGVGAEGMEANLATECHPETNTKCSQIDFAFTPIVISLGHRAGGKIVGVSRAVSNRESRYLRYHTQSKASR